MLRFYFSVGLTLILGFVVFGYCLIKLGNTQPIHLALRGFVEGCEGIPQPCWYGIVPGLTSHDEAEEKLVDTGYEVYDDFGFQVTYVNSFCTLNVWYTDAQKVDEIWLSQCAAVALGDLQDVIGDIEGTAELRTGGMEILFQNGRIGVWTIPHLDWSTTFVGVRIISLYSTNREITYSWHGFGDWTYYCRFEPEVIYC